MVRRWVLFLTGEPHLRRLYVRLLSRRGYEVHTTDDVEEANRLIRGDEVELAIVDLDLDDGPLERHLREWAAADMTPPLVLLAPPLANGVSATSALQPESPQGIDLVLQKPISPIEFAIQIDDLVDDVPPSNLEQDSVVSREFDAIQKDFVFQLDEDLQHLENHWDEFARSPSRPQLGAVALRRATAPIRSAARQFGFAELADELEAFESYLEPFLRPDAQLKPDELLQCRSHLVALRETCKKLQMGHPSVASVTHVDGRTQTLLVVDPDQEYLRRMRDFGEQFMIRVRTARNLEEAAQRVRTPLLTGVFLSLSATPSPATLRESIEALREASPLETLPLALIGDSGDDLDEVRRLWSGASVLISRPVTAATFSRAASRLAALRRAQKSSVLLIEPDDDFAQFLATHLETRHTAVHYYERPHSLFEKLEEHRPDLVLLSTHLSGVSAFDICRTLRAIPRWRAIPLIMTTRGDQTETRLAAYQSGADDVLCHDIEVEELRARIRVRIERIRLLRERADRDALTGLLTRRAFLEQLAARLSEAERHRRDLSFVLLDVDHFKKVNDEYGHPAGDRVLKSLGQLLRDCFRIEDLRARWGGEEFAVVLVDESMNTAEQALERILSEFSEMTFRGADNQQFHVTFSAGIAQYPDDGHDAETLLSAADRRLLRAKKGGRNTIVGSS